MNYSSRTIAFVLGLFISVAGCSKSKDSPRSEPNSETNQTHVAKATTMPRLVANEASGKQQGTGSKKVSDDPNTTTKANDPKTKSNEDRKDPADATKSNESKAKSKEEPVGPKTKPVKERRRLGHQLATGLAFHPDGKRLLSVSTDSTVLMWDLQTSNELKRFQSPAKEQLTCLALTKDGSRAVVGGYNAFFVLDVEKWQILHQIEYKKGMGALDVRSVAISSDDRTCLIGGSHLWDQIVYDDKGAYLPGFKEAQHYLLVFDLVRGTVVNRIKRNFTEHCNCMAFMPGDKQALVDSSSGQNPVIELIDLATGKRERTFEHSALSLRKALALSPDGKQLLTPHEQKGQGTMVLYEIGTGCVKQKFTLPPSLSVPNVNYFDHVRYIGDGKRAVFVGRWRDDPKNPKQYAVVLVWDVVAWKELQRFDMADVSSSYSLAVSSDGKMIAVDANRGIELLPLSN